MNETILAINFGAPEIILIIAVLLLLFGATRLPQLAKSLGQSKRAFREGLDEADEEERLEAARRRERLRSAETDAFDEDKAADKIPANKAR
jgi:sec-independent protein translocase protein TatA